MFWMVLVACQHAVAMGCIGFMLSISATFDGPLLQTKNGGRLVARTLRYGGPIGIKLGQYLSHRPDVVSPACIAELSKLTDSNPPTVPFRRVRELTQDLENLFILSEEYIIGTGSIAQVYRGIWKDPDLSEPPQAVAIKVVTIDTVVFQWEIRCCRWLLGTLSRLNILVEGSFFDDIARQVDLRKEAEDMRYAHELFSHTDAPVRVPRVLYADQHILVMELAPGVPLHQVPDPTRSHAARADAFCHMVTHGDRRFHADLHDGNLLWDEVGEDTWLIDFGLCCHPPPDWRFPLLRIQEVLATPPGTRRPTRLLMADLFGRRSVQNTEAVGAFDALVNSSTSLRIQPRIILDFVRRFGLELEPGHEACFMQLTLIETSWYTLSG